ncbi:MAG TPA: dihydrofolate reductase family protein [Streptosporangiaceae bacterium]|jgi:dihydrofolate reductase|nr:dihydrofolate reductase family protein [Streptosporangiaceae bacterium]
MRLALHMFLTLDGVMQAPGGPEEDPSGGFTHGGWQFPFDDDAGGAAVSGWFAGAGAFLLGRRTYEIFSGYWPKITDPANPVAAKLNELPKYVVSTTLTSADWEPATVISGDVTTEVAKLKSQPGGELHIWGSGVLAQTLIDADLIDEYRLMFHPVHLGTGEKLFRDGAKAASLRLLTSSVTSTGVVIATYEPAGPVQYGSY